MNENQINALSQEIIGAALEVHRNLGPGLLEHTYQMALMCELNLRGIKAQPEVEIPVTYKGVKLNTAYRADIIVENEIILELKSTENDNPLYGKQLLTYLKISNKRLGLLINFNRVRLVDGLKRVVNNL
ncbi:MAG: GxxExxY protein [Muribaculaceae bacterium]|nr:GxxExxY protein [Muribaculaceae bacterium]